MLTQGATALAPKFRTEADWTPRVEAVRTKLPALMTEFAARVKSGS